jgi:hypothetical protein
MTQALVLASLEIQRFRAFRHLQIERLGRVNLIVGKNNVGKTCLLEALQLYASQGDLSTIARSLSMRDEAKNEEQPIRHLFFGRQNLQRLYSEQKASLRIGPIDSPDDTLLLAIHFYGESVDESGQRRWSKLKDAGSRLFDVPAPGGPRRHLKLKETSSQLFGHYLPGLEVYLGDDLIITFLLDREMSRDRRTIRLDPSFKGLAYSFVGAQGLDAAEISQLWDSVTLTDLEQDVLSALKIIAPKVERINLVGGTQEGQERTPVVRIASLSEPIPLRSLGDGMNRLFSIALSLVTAKGGLLLIDEVDSGLHYTVQPEIWRLIFGIARRLNIQVFATTHSWDCIEAFQQALQQDAQGDGMLISLRDKEEEPGHVVAVLFDESELAIVTREQIEVR